MASQWLEDPNGEGIKRADINNDNIVNQIDFSQLANRWLEKSPPVVISEFMASNDQTLSTTVEGLQVWPDWLEIYNISSKVSISLDGWHLTDIAGDLTKWPFPNGISLAPDEYLLVFASEKNQQDYPENYPYIDTNGYLHANFNLNSSGEYLALVLCKD